MDLDMNGCPTNYGDLPAAPQCPPSPCMFCTGGPTPVDKQLPSWDWCQRFDTCQATVDWELVLHGR